MPGIGRDNSIPGIAQKKKTQPKKIPKECSALLLLAGKGALDTPAFPPV